MQWSRSLCTAPAEALNADNWDVSHLASSKLTSISTLAHLVASVTILTLNQVKTYLLRTHTTTFKKRINVNTLGDNNRDYTPQLNLTRLFQSIPLLLSCLHSNHTEWLCNKRSPDVSRTKRHADYINSGQRDWMILINHSPRGQTKQFHHTKNNTQFII